MSNRFNRRENNRAYKKVLLIVCCGETEVKYFELFRDKFKLKNTIIVQSSQSDDDVVVKEALVHKQTVGNVNEVWAVFDKDHSVKFNEVIKYAKENDIKCAFSNIAFEYWFYLHFKRDTKVMRLDEIRNELDKQLGFNYNKKAETITRVYKSIVKSITAAEDNAKRGHYNHVRIHGDDDPASYCSCTTVYELIDSLKKWNK